MGLIRLLLALSVLVDHSAPIFGRTLLGGELAVQCFYVLSGFYMAMVLEGAYAGRLGDFYRNRFLRLYPMYWVILVATVVLSGSLWWHSDGKRAGLMAAWFENGSAVGPAAWCLVGLAVVFLVMQDWLFFLGADPVQGRLVAVLDSRTNPVTLHRFLVVTPAWSLGVEVAFYLLVPWIARLPVRMIAALVVAAFGLKAWLGSRGLDFDPWTYRFFPTAIGYFLCGVLAWKLGRRAPLGSVPKWLSMTLWSALLSVGVFWIPGEEWCAPAYVVGVAALAPVAFELTRDWRWDRRLGDLSFPLYLCHPLVFAMTPKLWLPLRFLAALLVAAGLQWSIGSLIERWRSTVRTGSRT